MKNCIIIGISDSRKQWFPPEIMEKIQAGKVFSGGRRHHEIMSTMLPVAYTWIDITVPLSDVFKRYELYDDIIIFASGDPLFYGFANTVKRQCPDVNMVIYPAFNSLQMLAHRLSMPYHDMRVVSLTGRTWDKFDEALISGEQLIGCLTDASKDPHTIWQRMHSYGFDNYTMYVGECLGNEETEQVSIYKEEATYTMPNCIILMRTRPIVLSVGIPDKDFHLLNGRNKMITKMPVRLCTLSVLDLAHRHTFWDIGFCTGSISIESKRQYPHLQVISFEIREECKELMHLNTQRFHTPGINAIIGDFCKIDLSPYASPDAVFIGGHGGKLEDMLTKVHNILNDNGCIVFNSVSEDSKKEFLRVAASLGMKTSECYTLKVDDNNPITILKASC